MSNMNKKDINIAEQVGKSLRRRYIRERSFQLFGMASIAIALLFLLILIGSVITTGYKGFLQTYVKLEILLDPDLLEISHEGNNARFTAANYDALIKKTLKADFPDVNTRKGYKDLSNLISSGAVYQIQAYLQSHPQDLGKQKTFWLFVDDDVDSYFKETALSTEEYRRLPDYERRLNNQQLEWLDHWAETGRLEIRLNYNFFWSGDSREPELAGIGGAIMGSMLTLIVTLLLSFPIGIAAAAYLEEFAPRNKWTDLIEVNINNLAAVPSIVFGLLGLAVFINLMALPRSAPLVGGLVLTLMTLPTIIISSRAAIKAVPPSIREAALGVGASRMQMVMHHVLPLAMPGMLTGTIIGMARALGETAPLLMIGMVAFVVDPPRGIIDPATALPVQIFLWTDSPERAFVEKTSAAILVLLVFLVVMNGLAVYLRKKFERKW